MSSKEEQEIKRVLQDSLGAPGDANAHARAGRRLRGAGACTICRHAAPFCWSCTCGFRICQLCLEENRWGMTCNNVTWECPDCGSFRSF